MNVDVSTLAPTQVYHLMTQTIIPRPIAWVLTDSGEENYNLAPFSYFTAVSSRPPLLMLSIGKKPNGDVKDTTRNVLETGKLVIHIASSNLAQKVSDSSAILDHGQSELTLTNLETAEFSGFELPRLKDAPIAFGCKLHEVIEMGETPQSLIFAEIEHIYVDEKVISMQGDRLKVDALAVDPLSRLGGSEFATLDKTFSIARPQ